MATPGQEIDAYLDSRGTAEPERLDVAILFARSMFRELRDSAADWERTATALEEIKQQQQQQQQQPQQRTSGEKRRSAKDEYTREAARSAASRPHSRGAPK